MLTLTENAASAVKNITAQIPTETGGLRIRDTGAENSGFELALVQAPEETDAVVETDGARVFVDEVAKVALDDRILDAEVSEDGSVRFALGVSA
ncbi:Fe-S cluster assembly iron-binding protein IscA [Microbacterium halimionae]|uniref:Fe-S cluster assembly iron-binding protein IscA n=1 Tax=Microbacterium halimionae TaxID=1526413 RepID=A0A7W3PL71_9MICO|nr:iron-sulfur cluster biosynthesis family protein [Microbacterium halimionae]MBA8815681.1 Fe-S cluster assembly iron-binding protein IscA [Microbacterium halimionae]NII95727.1 Fe-S cluster assembly iron-binding protein IscA [Microbacterium halimionae]